MVLLCALGHLAKQIAHVLFMFAVLANTGRCTCYGVGPPMRPGVRTGGLTTRGRRLGQSPLSLLCMHFLPRRFGKLARSLLFFPYATFDKITFR